MLLRTFCLTIDILASTSSRSFSILIFKVAPRVDTQALINHYFDRNPEALSLFICKNEKCAPWHSRKRNVYKQEAKKETNNLQNQLRYCIHGDNQAKHVEHFNKCGGILDGICYSDA